MPPHIKLIDETIEKTVQICEKSIKLVASLSDLLFSIVSSINLILGVHFIEVLQYFNIH